MTDTVFSQKRHDAQSRKTLDSIQRWAPMIGGATLALLGLSRRSKSGLAVAAAGGLVAYIATNSNANSLLDRFVASASVVVDASPKELYDFWMDLEHFPLFMRHLEAVTVTENGRSHWVARSPVGTRVEWDAQIITQRENETISWQSLPGSDIEIEGQVTFRALPQGRGTLVQVQIRYRPGTRNAGIQFAKLLGKDPSFLMRQDLRRLKALVETGEVPTTEGQSHGRRSAIVGAARVLNPDDAIPPDVPIAEVYELKRRVS
jgi:uncharacterized membrane protein